MTYFFFFFNDTATTEIYTLSLHDALPISYWRFKSRTSEAQILSLAQKSEDGLGVRPRRTRSEEHTSELQSQSNLVCRLLLEKKKKSTRLLGPVLFRIQRALSRPAVSRARV